MRWGGTREITTDNQNHLSTQAVLDLESNTENLWSKKSKQELLRQEGFKKPKGWQIYQTLTGKGREGMGTTRL